jgi:HK97 family phage major capsid protein
VGTGGGFVSAQYLANELIEPLLPQLVMRAMGSRVLSGLTGGPVQIPRILTQSVPTAVLEGANKPNNEPVDQLPTMNPHEIGVYVEVSRWLDIMSNYNMAQYLAQDMVSAVLQLQDNFCLLGTGGAGQPVGLVTELLATPASLYVMLGDIGNGSLLVSEDVDNAITQQEQQDGKRAKVGWVCSPRTANRLTNLRDLSGGVGTGQFMFQEMRLRQANGQRSLAGLPLMTTTSILNNMVEGASGAVCSFAIYGDWNEQLIGEWGGLDFMMSEHFAFRGNRKAYRCSMLFDRMSRHIQSFTGIQGIL